MPLQLELRVLSITFACLFWELALYFRTQAAEVGPVACLKSLRVNLKYEGHLHLGTAYVMHRDPRAPCCTNVFCSLLRQNLR